MPSSAPPSASSTSMWFNLVVVVALIAIGTATATTAPTTSNIVGAGASFPERLYDALSFAFASELPQYSLAYTSLGSSKGKCRIMDHATKCNVDDQDPPFVLDWAGSDSIHKESDYTSYPDIQMFPAVAGAAVAVYNLPSTISDLVLPLDVLADIFRKCDPAKTCPPGWISHWNDTRIATANPDVALADLTAAGDIKVVVRADGSGTTEIWKQALATASSGFTLQMGSQLGESNQWPNCSVLRGNTNRGVAARIMTTPGSIGYVSLDEARSSGLRYAGIGRSVLDGVLRANERSIEYALLEKGFSFGNNADAGKPQRLTASVMGAKGSEAWPIVGYTYFSVRLNTTRPTDDDCSIRKSVLHWFEWFYQSDTVVDIAKHQGFAALPAEGRAYILSKVRSSFRCKNGRLVWTGSAEDFPVRDSSQERVVNVNVKVPGEIADVLSLYGDAYRSGISGFARISTLKNTEISPSGRRLDIIASSPVADAAVTNFEAAATPIELTMKDALELMTAVPPNTLLLPFAAIPWGITYNFCDVSSSESCAFKDLDMVLTPQLVVDILMGNVAYWNDTAIKDVQETAQHAAALPFLPVAVVQIQPSSREAFVFSRLLELRLGTTYNLSTAPSIVAPVASYEAAVRSVSAIPGSATFGPVNRQMDTTLARVARMRTDPATTGATSLATGDVPSVLACVDQTANGDAVRAYGRLPSSPNANCWPFTNAYFVAVPQQFSPDDCIGRGPQEAALFADFLMKGSNSTVQDPLSLVGMAKLQDPLSLLRLGEVQCFGRSITLAEVDKQLIPAGLIWASRAVAILMILVVIVLALWIFIKRTEPVLRASSPIFMWQMCLGFVAELCAVFALTIQDDRDDISQSQLDAACMAAPWLYVTGFTLVYGSLLAKTWRIYRIFNNPAMRRIHITAGYLTRLELLMSIPIFVVLILWTTLDPFVWVRTVATVDPTTGVPVATKGECASEYLVRYIVPILAIFATYILGGLILAWKNRDTPTEFSEGRYVTAAIMTDTELLIIGAPILVITSSNPIAAFVVKVLFIFLSVGATLGVFFYPKVAIVNGFWISDSSTGSNLLKPVNNANNKKNSKDSNRPVSMQPGSVIFDNNGNVTPRAHRGSSLVGSSRNESMFRTGSMDNMKDFASSFSKRPFFFTKNGSNTVLAEGDESGSRTSYKAPSGGNIVMGIGGPSDLVSAFPPPLGHDSSFSTAFDQHTPYHNSSGTGDEVAGGANSSKDSLGGNKNQGVATMFFGRNMFASSTNDLTAPNTPSPDGSSSNLVAASSGKKSNLGMASKMS